MHTELVEQKRNLLKDPYVQQVYNLPRVKDYLESFKAKKTRDTFRSALVKLNAYLETRYKSDCHSIIDLLLSEKVDAYQLLRGFISYLPETREGITPKSIRLYVSATRNYLDFYDIETHRFGNKVKNLPDIVQEKERALSKQEIQSMLVSCSNKRLKAYIEVLATSAIRADSEACTIRNCDVNFNTNPTTIKIRGDLTKTKATRYVLITPEATRFLKEYIDFRGPAGPEQLLFALHEHSVPKSVKETKRMSFNIYIRLNSEFIKLLEVIGLDKRKEIGVVGKRRHEIVLHSFRHFVKTTLSRNISPDFSELFLGHVSGNRTYFSPTDENIIADYQLCIPYLTFLDITGLELKQKDIESKLEQKDAEIAELKGYLKKYSDSVRHYKEEIEEYTAIEKRWIQDRKENDELKDRVGELSQLVASYIGQLEGIKPLLDAGIYWKKKVSD